MNLYNIFYMVKNFYYGHTYLALAVIASLLILLLLNPKAALKAVIAIAILLLAIYFSSVLGKSSLTGMDNKKQLIDRSR